MPRPSNCPPPPKARTLAPVGSDVPAANSKSGSAHGENAPRNAGSDGSENGAGTSDAVSGGATGADDGPSASGSPETGDGGGPSAEGTAGSEGEGGSLGETLEDTLNGLNGLLGGKDRETAEEASAE